MNNDHYLLTRDESLAAYYFVSEGSKRIQKGIFFQLLDDEEKLYNLAFGDWDDEAGYLDDMVRTDNSDTQKVLNTVAIAVVDFMGENPGAKLMAKGSTESRTRLYQISILKNIEDISKVYDLEGLKNGYWESFKNGVNYEGFLIKRRSLTL